jgi:hypothetical protein
VEIVEQLGIAIALVAACAAAYRLMLRAEREGGCGDGGACGCDAREGAEPLVRISRAKVERVRGKEQGG